jgi:hypothetical protein
MAACPEPGDLRAWIDQDEPAGAPVADLDDHLAACVSCRATAADLREGGAVAAGALARLAPSAPPSPAAVELARLRLARSLAESDRAPAEPGPARVTVEEGAPLSLAMPFRRWRVALSGLAAALALTLLVGTPEGRTAAAAFLAQFRGERLAVVTIDRAQNRDSLAQLERLGTLRSDRRGARGEPVRSVADASARVGFPVKQPDPATLPAGLDQTPKITVTPAGESRFTFDREKARAYFESVGRPERTLPDKLHGATLVVRMPAMVTLRYSGADGKPGLMIGQSGEVTADVEGGATLEEARQFLLGLPSLSPDVIRQLQDIKDWRNTLPLPIPDDKVSWQPTTVAGVSGVRLEDKTGLGTVLVWQRDGHTHGVAGPHDANELRRVANGLR